MLQQMPEHKPLEISLLLHLLHNSMRLMPHLVLRIVPLTIDDALKGEKEEELLAFLVFEFCLKLLVSIFHVSRT